MKTLIDKLSHLNKAQVSFAYGIAVAALTTLIQSGVFGGSTTTAQKVLTTIIAFASAVGIRSALPPKSN